MDDGRTVKWLFFSSETTHLVFLSNIYRVSHLAGGLGCIDFDSDVPQNYHQPKQNGADGGTLKIKVNSTHIHKEMDHPV